jgi:hypothetical protein
MIGRCGLDPNLNKCQHYIKDGNGCGSGTNGCCFWEQSEIKKETTEIREPKWFERYYR